MNQVEKDFDGLRSLLTARNANWVEDFERHLSRKPRVLHIGNIANNAYLNACLLNESGFDCDVISYNYYHAMGAPEWEDADLEAMPDDMFDPDWASIVPRAYVRPDWFVQGPTDLCLDYLLEKRSEAPDPIALRTLWRSLSANNRTLMPDSFASSPGFFLATKKVILVSLVGRAKRNIKRHLIPIFRKFRNLLVFPLIYFRARAESVGNRILQVFPRARPFLKSVKMFMNVAENSGAVLLSPSAVQQRVKSAFQPVADQQKNVASFLWLKQKYSEEFPGRSDSLSEDDFWMLNASWKKWEKLLDSYDFVIGYATDGIYPLLRRIPYVAFEHGTIRDIPYEETGRGRLTALTYRLASHVLVTNSDCVDSANYLAPGRFSTVNHPYDEDRPLTRRQNDKVRHQLKKELLSDVIVFHPARQDWVEGTGYADKANDHLWRAIGILRRSGIKVGVIACDWGENVADSKRLIIELNIEDSVKWVKPLSCIAFEQMFLNIDIVADQFFLGAFGGILPKALAASKPLVTYLKLADLANVYEEPPPVCLAKHDYEIASQLRKLAEDQGLRETLGRQGREWVVKHHGKRALINKQVEIFSTMSGHLKP